MFLMFKKLVQMGPSAGKALTSIVTLSVGLQFKVTPVTILHSLTVGEFDHGRWVIVLAPVINYCSMSDTILGLVYYLIVL